jgi:TPR repeat protein
MLRDPSPGIRLAGIALSALLAAEPAGSAVPAASPAADAPGAPAAAPAVAPGAVAGPGWRAAWTTAIRARDWPTALALARAATDRGDPAGIYALGLMHRDGAGLPRDSARARALFEQASAGHAPAAAAAGALQLRGIGGPVDLAAAHRSLTRAAEAGLAAARLDLSLLLADERFAGRDPVAAFDAAHRAALAGHAPAFARVGAMLLAGEGVARDVDRALDWWRQGAARGDAASLGRLGEALLAGRAGDADPKQGEPMLLRAAQAGDTTAMAVLATAYEQGTALPRDYAGAYRWASIALARDPAPQALRSARDGLEQRLSPEQVTRIQAEARSWTPRPLAATDGSGSGTGTGDGARGGSGTAFFVSPDGHALTNHHVVRGCRAVSTPAHGDAVVVHEDPAADLAVLRVAQPPKDWMRFRTDAARLGEPVYVFGYPLYGMLSTGGNFTAGLVSSPAGLRDDARRIQISAPIQPGNSGGAVLDRQGRVIAVAVAMLRGDALGSGSVPQNVNFAVDGAVARSVLGAAGVVPAIASESGAPLAPEELAARARSVSTVVRCRR